MKLIPTWPIAASLLALGVGLGVYVDHSVMQVQIEKINAAHSEDLRVREVQRAKDEAASRKKEQDQAAYIATIEQARVNENVTSRNAADALRERLRNQANSKPSNPSGMPKASATCETAAGPILPERTGNNLVALAQRADELRSALSACYQAYDQVAR